VGGDLRVFAAEGKSGRVEQAANAFAGHDEPGLRRKLGTSPDKPWRGRQSLRHVSQTNIAIAIHRRNKPLTAFVCHTLSNLRFDKAGAWLGCSNRDTNVSNESWFCSDCSGKAQ
jgi:hypothetical protein